MQKQMSSKKTIMIICAAAVVVVAAVIFLLSGKEETFRSVMVYELEGSAVIERADIGAVDAAENLYLESGDRVSVQQDSMMRMKLDDDKYITAEADTVFMLEAEGDGQNSKTRIRLERGAITNEIQRPLSGESLYETSTPNSVMAVRGTIYRVQLSDDGADGQDMRLCCFDGAVATKPILPDGTFGEEILVPAGSELTVYSDGTADGPTDIDYESLPEQAWQTLADLLENGAGITGITEEELAQIRQEAAQADLLLVEATDDVQGPVETKEEAAQNRDEEEQMLEAQQAEAGKASQQKDKTINNGTKTAKPQSDKRTDIGEKKPEDKAVQKPQDTPPAQGSTSDNSDSGNADGGSGQEPGSEGNSGDDNGKKPDDNRGDTPPKPPKPPKPEEEVICTVTYQYQGSIFATQKVKSGDKTAAPALLPTAEGRWNFDFSKAIKEDTVIEWESGN